MKRSGSKTVWSSLSINWRKGSGFVKDILCTINFWLRQTVLCMRMPLINGRAVSGILYFSAKKIGSLKIFEMTCTQAQPPERALGLLHFYVFRCKALILLVLIILAITDSTPAQTTANDGDWSMKKIQLANTLEADLMVRTGDIDNLGFGWPASFDPFSGNNTPLHSFPWTASAADPDGTDRIMVLTSYIGSTPCGQDGYTGATTRPANSVRPITLDFTFAGTITRADLLIFVDDFAAPVYCANFQVSLDGIRVPLYESAINALVQSGPIGKIIRLSFPNGLLHTLQDGKLQLLIDDLTTKAGDGYAIDFVKLLINPVVTSSAGKIVGKVTQFGTATPLQGVAVSTNGSPSVLTDVNGNYMIANVPSGLQLVQTYLAGYGAAESSQSIAAGQQITVNFQLKPVAPQLKYHSPSNNENVGIQTKVKLLFNRPIASSSFNSTSFLLNNGSTDVSGTFSTIGDTLVFNPSLLALGKTYTATTTTLIKSTSNINADQNYGFKFSTFSPLNITSQPLTIAVCLNVTASFSIAAAGTSNINYQWQKFNGSIFTDVVNGGGYSGTTSAAFNVNTTGNFGAGNYRCKVSGDFALDVFSNTVTLTVNPGCDIVVFNGISPNGDGLNDFLTIQNIELLPETKNNTVTIYSRWGDEVFKVSDYNNKDRAFKGNTNNGSKLPAGTYFYKIVLPDADKTMTGFISIKH